MKTIKIAHVITRMILGGAQENTLLSVEGLHAKSDYDVELITGPAIGPEGSLLDRAYNNGVNVCMVNSLRRNINPLFDCAAFLKLFVKFRKEKYDIVHTHSSKAGVIARIAAYFAGVPVIVHTIHGLPFHDYAGRFSNFLYISLEKLCAKVTTKIVTVCPEMSRKAIEKGIGSKEDYLTVYSGIEVNQYQEFTNKEKFEFRSKYNIPDGAFVVGKIARLFHLKGHKYLLQSAKLVIDRNPNVYFVLVGDGILRDSLQEECQKLGIINNVIFAGLLQTREIPFVINGMDAVVHLSLREGLPRVIPQAFLLSKPVISYDIDGAKDIVDNGLNGYLVKSHTIIDVAESILSLAQHPEYAREMGARGYLKAIDIFPAEKMVNDLDNLYKTF